MELYQGESPIGTGAALALVTTRPHCLHRVYDTSETSHDTIIRIESFDDEPVEISVHARVMLNL